MPSYLTLAAAQQDMEQSYGQVTGNAVFCRGLNAPAEPNQYGATCGIYALRNVMRYHYNNLNDSDVTRLRKTPQLAARKHTEGKGAIGKDGVCWVPERPSIREIAKASGLTLVGELLDGKHVKKLAEKLGYTAEAASCVTNLTYCNKLKELLGANVPPIVSMDVENGVPTLKEGLHGHWVVIVGYEPRALGDVVYIMHWGKYYADTADNLAASSLQLERFPGGVWNKALPKNDRWKTDVNSWKHRRNSLSGVGHAKMYDITRGSDPKTAKRLHMTNTSQGLKGMIVGVRPSDHVTNSFAPHVTKACDAWEATLTGWFRKPSQESRAAVTSLKTFIENGWGLSELLDMVNHLLGGQLQSTEQDAQGVGRLKPGSTFHALLTTARESWKADKPSN